MAELNDPFADPSTAAGVQITILLRIYDAVMALLTAVDKEKSLALIQEHKEGNIVGYEPYLSGVFLAEQAKD